MPALHATQNARDRIELEVEMDRVACALGIYRSDHGEYPEKLDQLMPKYITAIPDDTFAGEPTAIRYRREGDVYTMWTVHLNGIDDDGRGPEDEPPGDDWVLRPVPGKSGDKK
jgi:hypothetical protein